MSHEIFCDCLDCLGGVPATATRVYSDATPGPIEEELAQVRHGDRHRTEDVMDGCALRTWSGHVAAWDAQAKAVGLSRRAWMRRVLNAAAGVQ